MITSCPHKGMELGYLHQQNGLLKRPRKAVSLPNVLTRLVAHISVNVTLNRTVSLCNATVKSPSGHVSYTIRDNWPGFRNMKQHGVFLPPWVRCHSMQDYPHSHPRPCSQTGGLLRDYCISPKNTAKRLWPGLLDQESSALKLKPAICKLVDQTFSREKKSKHMNARLLQNKQYLPT